MIGASNRSGQTGVRTVLAMGFFLSSLLLAARAKAGEDWPQFLGPHADGTSSKTGLLDRWPTNGPPVVWEKKVGTGYGAPSVRNNLLVLHHRLGDEEVIEAFVAASGQPIWRYAYPAHFVDPYGYNNGPRSTPLLTADHCYAFGAEGKLTCLDLNTGKLVWQRDTAADWNVPPAFFGVGSSPVLDGGMLLVWSADSRIPALWPSTPGPARQFGKALAKRTGRASQCGDGRAKGPCSGTPRKSRPAIRLRSWPRFMASARPFA